MNLNESCRVSIINKLLSKRQGASLDDLRQICSNEIILTEMPLCDWGPGGRSERHAVKSCNAVQPAVEGSLSLSNRHSRGNGRDVLGELGILQ